MPSRCPKTQPADGPAQTETGFGDLSADDLRDLAGLSQEWLWQTDAGGRLVRLSEGYETLAGAQRRPVLGRVLAEVLEPVSPASDDRDAVIADLVAGTAFAGRTCTWLVEPERAIVVRLGGKPRFSTDGGFEGFHGLAVNITEGWQRERAWRASVAQSELLVATIESCPVSIFIADAVQPGLPLIYVNPSFTRITGYALHESVGRPCDFLEGPETAPDTLRRLRDAMASGQPADVEILSIRKDGTPFWAALTVAPLLRQGGLVAWIGVQIDITDKRLHQAEMQRHQKLQALGQLAGGVAHEINNLLQPMLSFGELARQQVAADHPGAAQRIGRVLGAAERAGEIVRNILRFSRNDGATLCELDLAASLTEAVAFVRDVLPASVRVTTSGLERDLGRVRINAVELTQVLTNLMVNAAQAMEGRGEIRITATPARVTPYQASVLGIGTGDYSLVTVADGGPGMDDSVLSHVFEPFFTTKPAGQGTGLGLSVVYGILQNWRGTVTVASAPGQGARFTLHIPRLPPADGQGATQDQALSETDGRHPFDRRLRRCP